MLFRLKAALVLQHKESACLSDRSGILYATARMQCGPTHTHRNPGETILVPTCSEHHTLQIVGAPGLTSVLEFVQVGTRKQLAFDVDFIVSLQ